MKLWTAAQASVFLLVGCGAANASEEDARASKTMYGAWQCATYAEMKGDPAEQQRLFTLGYEKGKAFLAAVKAGTITEWEKSTIVPVGVSLLIAGPTEEFILGRIFEGAMGHAYDSIVATDSRGIPLNPADYITDNASKSVLASTKYRAANCELLR